MGVPVFGWAARKLFGTRNQRLVNRYLTKVDQVSALEDQVRTLTDPELRAKTAEFQGRFENGESSESMMAEIFAVAREAMDRAVGIRNIFNPDHGFDPEVLEGEARAAYEKVLEEIESTDPAEPDGDFLGSTLSHNSRLRLTTVTQHRSSLLTR